MTKRCRYKACGLMAATAITVSWYMVWWRRFASGGYTIVARNTVIHNTCVIIAGTDKGRGVMAYGAILAIRGKMGRCQASRCYTIMARGTVIGNTGMIEHRWYKGTAGHMADLAIFSGCHMGWIGFGIFADCINTIVAEITPFTRNVGAVMVDKCTEETGCVMAHATIPACVAVNGAIRRSSGTCYNIIRASIMAGGTVITDTRVSNNRGKECSNRMAEVAVLNRRQMACRLDDIGTAVSGRKELTDMATFAAPGKA